MPRPAVDSGDPPLLIQHTLALELVAVRLVRPIERARVAAHTDRALAALRDQLPSQQLKPITTLESHMVRCAEVVAVRRATVRVRITVDRVVRTRATARLGIVFFLFGAGTRSGFSRGKAALPHSPSKMDLPPTPPAPHHLAKADGGRAL